MNVLEMKRWINRTGIQLHHSNTYVSDDVEMPHETRIRYGYKLLAQYRNGDYLLTVHDLPMSSPRCYYVTLGHTEEFFSVLDRMCAFIDARSILPYLVRFNWRLVWSTVRQSFNICIPERDVEFTTYPLWFTRITIGYQTIWYTTEEPGQIYREKLLWTEDGNPIVEDYTTFLNIGSSVSEIYD